MSDFINVTIKTNKDFYKNTIKGIDIVGKKSTYILAKETERTIKAKIKESIKRPGSKGTLADAFETYMTLNGHGVGKISYLNKVVPYWRHQEYGSEAIGANWKHRVPKGRFSPGEAKPDIDAFRSGRWIGNGNYSFIPKNPIPAKNYILKTLAEILPNIKNILKDVK